MVTFPMPLVLQKPNYPPYVCIVCGVGERRKWFVDLQLPINHYFNPLSGGAVYLCSECWDSIAVETTKQAQVLLIGTEAWTGEGYVEPTYDNQDELISELTQKEKIDVVRLDPGELSLGSSKRTDPSPTEDDRPTTTDSGTPESSDIDESTESVREFREHFRA